MKSRWIGTGLLVVISAPSGGGKTTVIRALRHRRPEFWYSVSVTTRPRRRGERDGVHYHFITPAQFAALRSRRALVEWARVHDHHYGTPRANLERARRAGRVLLFDIDVQGAASLRRSDPDMVSIFLRPPSFAELRRRLLGRRSEGTGERARRLVTARRELARADEYDYIVTNEHVPQCVSDCEAIIRAELLRRERRKSLV
ncbi:MAG: guanylate kinase [Candidatus Zixiibacteriota bacterium]